MMQNETKTAVSFAEVGEAISHDLAAKMIKDYQDTKESAFEYFVVGRNILTEILAQPGCVGMRIYNALDASGNETLVYVGVDNNGHAIVEYSAVNNDGKLHRLPAIVADRVGTGTDETTKSWFSK